MFAHRPFLGSGKPVAILAIVLVLLPAAGARARPARNLPQPTAAADLVRGGASASGVYFYEVRMDNEVQVGKLALIR